MIRTIGSATKFADHVKVVQGELVVEIGRGIVEIAHNKF